MRSAVICADCDCDGPVRETSREARAAAKADGWSRVNRGGREAFRCPRCRSRRGRGPRPAEPGTIVGVAVLAPYRGWPIHRVETDPPPPSARYWYIVGGRPYTMHRYARAYVDTVEDRRS